MTKAISKINKDIHKLQIEHANTEQMEEMGMNTIKSSSIRLLNGELPKPPKVNDQVEVLDFS